MDTIHTAGQGSNSGPIQTGQGQGRNIWPIRQGQGQGRHTVTYKHDKDRV